MNKMLKYFTPNGKIAYLDVLIIKYFIYQSLAGLALLLLVISYNLISHNDNYLVSSLSEGALALFLILSLYLLKFKGMKLAGNIFYLVMLGIILVTVNILKGDIDVLFKFVHGFYTMMAFLVAGAMFASRIVIIINAILIFFTTTHIYFYGLALSNGNTELITSGYIYHTVSLLIITVVLFFIKKFTKQTIKKMNHEAEIIESQNRLLQESKLNLSAINKSKDKFFSIIAHDLKGPLSSILGASNLLLENIEDYNIEEKKKFIGLLQQSSQHTYDLLNNLLIWANTQEGLIEFNPKDENLKSICEETVGLFVHLARDKKINIVDKIPTELNAPIDRNIVLTILRNLLSNAIKFTPKDGQIIISAEKTSKNHVKVCVKDSGNGIPSKLQSSLFNISDNLSTTGTEGETGTGLGLNICYEFAKIHGGTIWVESEEQKGCEFVFTLPNEQ